MSTKHLWLWALMLVPIILFMLLLLIPGFFRWARTGEPTGYYVDRFLDWLISKQ